MNKIKKEERSDKIFTIPNVLSAIRLCLIPVFVYLYCVREDFMGTAAVLLVSGITDIVDGFIARQFNMTSNLGKALDPVADKLTQIAMLFCLVTRFQLMIFPLVLLVVKEIIGGISGLMVIHRTGEVHGAVWHGKVTTCLLYALMIIHVIWYNIPISVSTVLTAICITMMLVSLLLYGIRNIRLILACPTTIIESE